MVVGLPALRLRGLTLGVVTLALAYAIEAVWFRNADIVSSSGARVTPPSMLGIDLGIGAGEDFPRIEFGLLCLFTLVAVALGVAALRRSALGSAMLAVRANERSAAAVGVNVVRVKVLAFALASFIAGLGGSLLAYRRGVVTFDSFTAIGGLALLSTAYLAGVTSVWGGINAGILAASGIVFIALDRWVELGAWFQVITGVLLVATLIAHPEGIASAGHELADGRRAAVASDQARGEPPRRVAATAPSNAGSCGGEPRSPRGRARVENLRVRYGGVVGRRRRVAARRPREDRRADRPERCRQDERHRRHHRLRAGDRVSSSLPGSTSRGSRRTPASVPGSPARFQQLELYDDLIGGGERQRGRLRRSPGQSAGRRGTGAPPRRDLGIGGSPGGRAEPGRTPARVHRACLRRRAACAAARRTRRGPRHE